MDRVNQNFQSIDEYIGTFPENVQETLKELRAVIRAAAPGATEKISYQMPAFAWNGILVYFAAYKRHIGFYPTGSGVEAFRNELAEYKGSKGSVQFPIDEPMPYDLIRRIVQFRVEENSKKSRSEINVARLEKEYERG